jgi:N-acetylglucosamine-6-sulfatase
MNLKILMRTAVAVALLTSAPLLAPAPARAAPAKRPNIVVIMADDQDDMGSVREMKELQKLAGNGVTFTNSFVDFSLCCPSRASFLTGQAAHNSTIMGNKAPNGGWPKFKLTEGNSLGVWLQAAGYRTALMGKLMNGYGQEGETFRTHVMPGWNEWDVVSDPNGPYRYFNYTMNENGVLNKHGHEDADYQTDVIAAKGEDFIRSSKGPFFLLMQPIAPHGTHGDETEDGAKGFPLPAPREDGHFDRLDMRTSANFNEDDVSDKPGMISHLDRVDPGAMQASFRKRREAMLAVDDMIKRVVNTLTATGKLDNTIIVVTSDNGYSEGSHRYQGKIVLYEESIRVPLIISGPGIPKGAKRDQMVNNLDLVASIIDWSGATPGRVMDGRSLASVMADASTPWRTGLLLENNHAFGIRTKDWLYSHLRSGKWGEEREMYDLSKDPRELDNIADKPAYRHQQDALKDLVETLSTCVGDSCWVDGAMPQTGPAN